MTTIYDVTGFKGTYNDSVGFQLEVIRNGCLSYMPAKSVQVGDLVTVNVLFESQAKAGVYIAELLPVVKVERE